MITPVGPVVCMPVYSLPPCPKRPVADTPQTAFTGIGQGLAPGYDPYAILSDWIAWRRDRPVPRRPGRGHRFIATVKPARGGFFHIPGTGKRSADRCGGMRQVLGGMNQDGLKMIKRPALSLQAILAFPVENACPLKTDVTSGRRLL